METGTLGVAPAMMNAVEDALRPPGITTRRSPARLHDDLLRKAGVSGLTTREAMT